MHIDPQDKCDAMLPHTYVNAHQSPVQSSFHGQAHYAHNKSDRRLSSKAAVIDFLLPSGFNLTQFDRSTREVSQKTFTLGGSVQDLPSSNIGPGNMSTLCETIEHDMANKTTLLQRRRRSVCTSSIWRQPSYILVASFAPYSP